MTHICKAIISFNMFWLDMTQLDTTEQLTLSLFKFQEELQGEKEVVKTTRPKIAESLTSSRF